MVRFAIVMAVRYALLVATGDVLVLKLGIVFDAVLTPLFTLWNLRRSARPYQLLLSDPVSNVLSVAIQRARDQLLERFTHGKQDEDLSSSERELVELTQTVFLGLLKQAESRT